MADDKQDQVRQRLNVAHEIQTGQVLDLETLPASAIRRQRRDEARAMEGAAPNFGREVLPHIYTMQGRAGTVSKSYRPSDEALRDSKENARYMRNELLLMECLEARKRGSALLNWHLVPEDPKDTKQQELCADLTTILERIPDFTEYRMWLLEAIWFGRVAAFHRYNWKRVEGNMRCLPIRWTPINGDKLVFRYDDGSARYDDNQIGIRVGAGYHLPVDLHPQDLAVDWSRKVEPTEQSLAYFIDDYERDLMALHRHIIEDGAYEDPLGAGSIHGTGVRSRCYWTWFQMQECLAYLMEYLERSAFGMELWYYPSGNAEAEAKTRTAAEERIGGGRSIVLVPKPVGEEGDLYGVDRIEPGLGGVDALRGILEQFFGWKIKRYILGQILTSESEATGLGSGVADLHFSTYIDIVRYDSQKLGETITNDLVRVVKDYNFPKYAGCHVQFKIDTESPEAEKKLEAYRMAYDMGLRIKAEDVATLIGASMPDEDDEVLQAQQGGGGDPGGGGLGDMFGGDDPTQPDAPDLGGGLLEDSAEDTEDTGTPNQVPDEYKEFMGKEGEPERYADFVEEEHPRDEGGKFTTGGQRKPKGEMIGWESEEQKAEKNKIFENVKRHGGQVFFAKIRAIAGLDVDEETRKDIRRLAGGKIVYDGKKNWEYRIKKQGSKYAFQFRHRPSDPDTPDNVWWETIHEEKLRRDLIDDAHDEIRTMHNFRVRKAKRIKRAIETGGESEGMTRDELDEAIKREHYAKYDDMHPPGDRGPGQGMTKIGQDLETDYYEAYEEMHPHPDDPEEGGNATPEHYDQDGYGPAQDKAQTEFKTGTDSPDWSQSDRPGKDVAGTGTHYDKEFDESEHPRDEGGKFTSGSESAESIDDEFERHELATPQGIKLLQKLIKGELGKPPADHPLADLAEEGPEGRAVPNAKGKRIIEALIKAGRLKGPKEKKIPKVGMNRGDTIHITISKNSPNLESLEITEAREKAIRVRNKETGKEAWIPKSGIKPRKPGEPTYEDEFVLADWFRRKLSAAQERALGVSYAKDGTLVQYVRPHDMGRRRAPKGGVTIGGRKFKGGEFIPKEYQALQDAQEGKPSIAVDHTRAQVVDIGGDKFQVKKDAGMWFFRRSTEAGWTAASKPTQDIIEKAVLPEGGSKAPGPRVGAAVVNVDDISVDPTRFQYKRENINPETGASANLSDVHFNPALAGHLDVWYDPENGQTYVINGHHRVELARRSGWHGELPVNYIKADNENKARAMGALINIAEGHGTAMDAGRFIKEQGLTGEEGIEKFRQNNVSLKSDLAQKAVALANLSDRAFQEASYGRLSEAHALAIGETLVPEGDDSQKEAVWEAQGKIVRRIQKAKRVPSTAKVQEMAVIASLAPTIRKADVPGESRQTKIFGDDDEEERLFEDRAEVQAHVRSELSKKASQFESLAAKGRGELVQETGIGEISEDKAREHRDSARDLLDTFRRGVKLKGDISGELNEILNEAAEEHHNARTAQDRKSIRRRTATRVREYLSSAGADPERGAGRDDAGGGEAGPGAVGEPERINVAEVWDYTRNPKPAPGTQVTVGGPSQAARIYDLDRSNAPPESSMFTVERSNGYVLSGRDQDGNEVTLDTRHTDALIKGDDIGPNKYQRLDHPSGTSALVTPERVLVIDRDGEIVDEKRSIDDLDRDGYSLSKVVEPERYRAQGWAAFFDI